MPSLENFAPFQYRRALDLILPPIQAESLREFKIGDHDLDWLISDLEGGKRTGCVKVTSAERRSRSAMLLYRGRAVGSVYCSYFKPDILPAEESLKSTFSDLSLPDTKVMLYDLPENVILGMSALFLGFPVAREDSMDAPSYVDHMCSSFEQKGTTACLAISLKKAMATCFVFVCKGEFCGAFYVENQTFFNDKHIVARMLRNDPMSVVEASVLTPEMTSSAVSFGFSLSQIRKEL